MQSNSTGVRVDNMKWLPGTREKRAELDTRYPDMTPETGAAVDVFLEKCEDNAELALRLNAIDQVFARDPKTAGEMLRGLDTFVKNADDPEGRVIRVRRGIGVLEENRQVDGPTFVEAANATAGAYNSSEATQRLREQASELQARHIQTQRDLENSLAGTPADASNAQLPGDISLDLLARVNADPAVELATRASAVATERLGRFHQTLDTNQAALFQNEPGMFTRHKNNIKSTIELAGTSVAAVGVIGAIVATNFLPPLAAGLRWMPIVLGLGAGLAGDVYVQRKMLKAAPAKIEAKMRKELEPQRQWWTERSAQLEPFVKEVRDKTLLREYNEWVAEGGNASSGNPDVEVGDDSVVIGGIKIGRRTEPQPEAPAPPSTPAQS